MTRFLPDFFTPFEDQGTGFGPRIFRNAHLRLAAAYATAIALVMVAFSLALYFSVYASTTSTLEATEGLSSIQEHHILDAQLGRARIALIVVNLAGWLLAAGASYFIAGWTLGPIKAAIERQRRFTAHASHELRTPLTVIRGEIDVTMARERSPDEYRETLSRIGDEIQHLDSMADRLLALARLEARDDVPKTTVNVGEALGNALAQFREVAAEREVDLVAESPPDLEATLDWDRVGLLLNNLVSNALHHVNKGGLVLVTALQAGPSLRLTVFNSGSAIAAKDLPHIFLPFYRGAGEAGDGSGLGLALCELVVRAHGGSILARSEPQGVSFTANLPL